MLSDYGLLLLELYGAAREMSIAEFPEFAFTLIRSAQRLEAVRCNALSFLPLASRIRTRTHTQGVDTAFDWGPVQRRSARHDRRLLEALMPHVVQALRINEALGLRAMQVDAGMRASLAIAAPDGAIHFAGPGFFELMRREWPQWPGADLPDCILDRVRGTGGHDYTGRLIEVSLRRRGEWWFVQARASRSGTCLSSRERHVAALYGIGRSHKAIARELRLSPATVRNHLQHIYAKLGVNDKAQLAVLMAREGGPDIQH